MDRIVFRFRNVLAGLPLVFALFSFHWEWENDWAVWLIALLLCGLGIAVRSWAASHCNYAQGKRKQLTTTGPYAYVRHPLYVGNTLVLAGATFASELWWLLPVSLAWALLVYTVTTRHEERRLLEKYGDAFLDYRAAVPAWWPRWRMLCQEQSPFFRALRRQLVVIVVLLPFALKELLQ